MTDLRTPGYSGPPPPCPPKIDRTDVPVWGLRWPSNRLTYGQIARLRVLKKLAGVPINQLVKDAVDLQIRFLLLQMKQITNDIRAADPELSPNASDKSVPTKTVIVTESPVQPESAFYPSSSNVSLVAESGPPETQNSLPGSAPPTGCSETVP